ncbi:hypothetical protein [Acetobacter estunensis]|uniref:hypothetical protein n=1 Tax=Acetobacter estunensis TaxID=104097 RepID=UPI001C2DE4F4|nr:hypothetical protein [Acetobacter estunensis]MBV1835603.1 hypothetical protein [Acetobacter estunensis]MBV1836136.1 hypothetical protein [Acetobacter estunensis]
MQVEQEKKEQAEQEKTDLLRIINEALSDIRTQMGARLKNYAETLASTLISTAVSAFPQWPEHDNTFCSATLLQEILPLFTGDFRVVLRLHPHNVEILEEELSSQSSVDRSWLIIEPDTAVQKSDFEMKWPDGELKRNLGDLSETILMALSTNTTTSLSTGSAS